jgi:MtrB/PioB family decaheme-associated outer membrane protein
VSLGIQYQEGHAEAFYRPTEEIEGRVRYWIQQRSGARKSGIAFGSPGGNFSTFAAPEDDRIQNIRAGLEWAEPGWSVALGYDGSIHTNEIDSLIVANPLRATNQFPLTGVSATGGTSAPTFGRLSVAPGNSAHGLNLTGAAEIPVGFPMRVAATFGYQLRLQDEDFVPQTINAVLNNAFAGARTLGRDSLEGQVNVWLANIVLTGHPLRDLDFALRYRVYEFDNTTGLFHNQAELVTDSTFSTTTVENTPLDWLKQNLGFDAGYRITPELKLDFTLGWDSWRRSELREVRHQNDHLVGAHLEARPAEWAVIRTGYSWANRRWGMYVPTPGELPQLRKYDQANRVENAVDALIQLTPIEPLQLSMSGSYGYWAYGSSDYGLTNSRFWTLGGEVSYQPFERLGFTAWYSYESISDNQTSRNSPGAPLSPPTNDWFSRFKSGASTAGTTANIVVWPSLVDLQLNWLFQTSQNNTLTTGASAASGAFGWPKNGDNLLSIGPTLAVHVTDHVTIRGTYRYERYRLDDFQINNLSPYMPFASANSTDVFLGGRIDNYDANVFGISAQYKF